jgi:hypothetical protein
MKAGDTVLVQQQDSGPHWIYATVITPNADGSAFVQIRHPGNREHGEMQFFGGDLIRTKANVQAMIADMPADAAGPVLQQKRSLQIQADLLS